MKTVRADKYCKFVTDGTHDSPKQVNKGRKLITSKHLSRYGIDFESAKNISELDYQKVISRSKVEQWDILFSMIGTIGNLYLERNHTIEYACKNMGIFQMGGDARKAKWLYYYLQTPKARKYIETSGRGTTQSYVPLAALRALPIDVVDDFTRDKIIKILWNIDEKILTNMQVNENLEWQAQAYFEELFVVNADPNWPECTLSDIGSIVAGGTPSKSKPEYYADQGIAWITPKDLSVDKSKFISHGENDISELGFSKSSTKKMPAGTVLFSSRAPIGYIAIAQNEFTTNQGFKSVIPNKNIGTSYVYFLLKNLLPTIEGMASGSTFKEISGAGMKSVPTVMPDVDTIQLFNNFCEPIFKEQEILEAENHRLSTLRDSLLPKLMSGEIDISLLDS